MLYLFAVRYFFHQSNVKALHPAALFESICVYSREQDANVDVENSTGVLSEEINSHFIL